MHQHFILESNFSLTHHTSGQVAVSRIKIDDDWLKSFQNGRGHFWRKGRNKISAVCTHRWSVEALMAEENHCLQVLVLGKVALVKCITWLVNYLQFKWWKCVTNEQEVRKSQSRHYLLKAADDVVCLYRRYVHCQWRENLETIGSSRIVTYSPNTCWRLDENVLRGWSVGINQAFPPESLFRVWCVAFIGAETRCFARVRKKWT